MSIDWVTVAAQIANFLVLVWLLKHFLYQPVLDGIDAREAEISSRMSQAGEAQKKATVARLEYEAQKEQLLADRQTMVEQAIEAAQNKCDAMLASAHARIEQEQQDWQQHLQHERQKFTARLEKAGAETLLEMTRKALRDLADESLEQAIVRHVTDRLKPIAPDIAEVAGESRQAVATTHNPLPPQARDQLQADLEKMLPGIAVSFDTDLTQAPGLVLRVGSAQVIWTVDGYIDEFDALLNERLAVSASGRINTGVG